MMRYRAILLLAVGLAAFSSAMKELNQLRQFSLDASRLIAQLADKMAPAQVPQTIEITHTAAKVTTCQSKQSLPTVELPWLAHVEEQTTKEPIAVKPRRARGINITKEAPARFEFHFAKLKKVPSFVIDPKEFEVRISEDHDSDQDGAIISEPPVSLFKTKSRRNGAIRINPRDREMLLKLNRSINLRIAS